MYLLLYLLCIVMYCYVFISFANTLYYNVYCKCIVYCILSVLCMYWSYKNRRIYCVFNIVLLLVLLCIVLYSYVLQIHCIVTCIVHVLFIVFYMYLCVFSCCALLGFINVLSSVGLLLCVSLSSLPSLPLSLPSPLASPHLSPLLRILQLLLQPTLLLRLPGLLLLECRPDSLPEATGLTLLRTHASAQVNYIILA